MAHLSAILSWTTQQTLSVPRPLTVRPFHATQIIFLTLELSGQIVIHALSTTEAYAFDLKRPMRTVALEPQFAKKSSRAFVCGGLAGSLVLHEKGWLGHKETVLHSGEGPVWQARWRGRLIAWANDLVGSTVLIILSPSRSFSRYCWAQ